MWGECRKWRIEIDEAGEGAALGVGARAHLDACASCRTAHRESLCLRHLVGNLERVEAPPDFDLRLRARLARQADARRQPRLNLRPAFGLAASACLVVLFLITIQRGYDPTADERAAVPAVDGEAETATGVGPPETQTSSTDSRIAGPKVAAPGNSERTTLMEVAGRRALRTQARRMQSLRASVSADDVREESDAVLGSHVSQVHTISKTVEEENSVPARPFAIAISRSDEPLRVVLLDEKGGTRSLPVRPVSFGAQEIVARERTAQKASSVEQEGVW